MSLDSRHLTRRQALYTSLSIFGVAELVIAAPEGWSDSDLITPKAFADRLAANDKVTPVHVGFNVMFRSKRIPGSLYGGPGNKPEGLEVLKKAVAGLSKDSPIVIYCGCCPWVHCPNMKPSFDTLKDLGFKDVKAMLIGNNFATDWVRKGYPVEG